jgi:hypothetical protein
VANARTIGARDCVSRVFSLVTRSNSWGRGSFDASRGHDFPGFVAFAVSYDERGHEAVG